MKKKNLWIIALVAIITIGIIGCNGEDDLKPETFTVTFHANGGTPQPPTQTVDKGKTADEPQVSKSNCELEGWYKESGFTTKWNFAINIVTANIDLYAQWSYGKLPNSTINIFKGEGVTDEQMADTVAKIYEAGILDNDDLFSSFKEIIHSIYVKTGKEVIRKGNIVEVGCEATESEIGTYFVLFALGED